MKNLAQKNADKLYNDVFQISNIKEDEIALKFNSEYGDAVLFKDGSALVPNENDTSFSIASPKKEVELEFKDGILTVLDNKYDNIIGDKRNNPNIRVTTINKDLSCVIRSQDESFFPELSNSYGSESVEHIKDLGLDVKILKESLNERENKISIKSGIKSFIDKVLRDDPPSTEKKSKNNFKPFR